MAVEGRVGAAFVGCERLPHSFPLTCFLAWRYHDRLGPRGPSLHLRAPYRVSQGLSQRVGRFHRANYKLLAT